MLLHEDNIEVYGTVVSIYPVNGNGEVYGIVKIQNPVIKGDSEENRRNGIYDFKLTADKHIITPYGIAVEPEF